MNRHRIPEARALLAAAAAVAIVTAALAVSALAGLASVRDVIVHALLLGAVVAALLLLRRIPAGPPRTALAAVTAIGSMFFLYGSLGHVAFEAIPWSADPWLRQADRLLGLGVEPALAAARWVEARPWAVEPLAFFYAAYIPYLYLTIFLGLVARPAPARQVFLLAFALLYGAAFLGYLFLPAKGPIVEMAEAFGSPLPRGTFRDLVVRTIDAMGGPHGAFPSLHVGASVLAMAFDLRHGDRLRGLIYVPLVALIAVATVALRYHYAIDLVAGAALALLALEVAGRWQGIPDAPAPVRRGLGATTIKGAGV